MTATFIAIDLGTTTIKGAVVDAERRQVGPVRALPFPAPVAGLPALWCEIDPGAIISAVRTLIAELAAHAPGCAGVVMCGQTGGLMLTDERGAPLSNYISWRDQRAAAPPAPGAARAYDRLSERLSPAARRALGQEVRPGTTLSYLFWLVEAGPLGTPGPLPRGATAANLADWVCAHLCGAAAATHPTQAMGALNLETGDWHHAALADLGLERVRWPALRDFREPVGRLRVNERPVECYAPVGDQQCALAGTGLAPGELSLNISTGSQVGRLTERLALGDYQTRPYFDGQFLNTITHLPAGRALNVLLDLLSELARAQGVALDDPWDYLQRAAEAAGDTDLVVDLAFFPGTGGPAGVRGAIGNIQGGNLTAGRLFRAALRNMAEHYQAAALRLAPNRDWHRLAYSGGLAQRLPLLRQLIAERLPGPSRSSAGREETLAGLLALALVISGRASTVAEAAAALREGGVEVEDDGGER